MHVVIQSVLSNIEIFARMLFSQLSFSKLIRTRENVLNTAPGTFMSAVDCLFYSV